MTDPEGWKDLKGGCRRKCEGVLPCGHPCRLTCHPFVPPYYRFSQIELTLLDLTMAKFNVKYLAPSALLADTNAVTSVAKSANAFVESSLLLPLSMLEFLDLSNHRSVQGIPQSVIIRRSKGATPGL